MVQKNRRELSGEKRCVRGRFSLEKKKMNSFFNEEGTPNHSKYPPNQIMSSKSINQSKTFCKVCYDAGKTDAEYTSHNVRSLSVKGVRKVTCPLLLSQECRFCGKNGHTKSYCPVLEQRKKNERKYDARVEYELKLTCEETTKSKKVDRSRTARFEILSDELKEMTQKFETVYPVAKIYVKTYASALSEAKIHATPVKTQDNPPPPAAAKERTAAVMTTRKLFSKRWSEMEDSSDEEEE